MKKVILPLVFLIGCGYSSVAQPDNPPLPDVPITGIEILIGLGGLLGIKKINDLRKKR